MKELSHERSGTKRAESVFSHETAEMQANLLLRREDIFSHVPCTRDFAKFLKEMRCR